MKVNYHGDENIQFDIGLNSEVLEESPLTFFSDDSLNLIERPFYSADYARINLGLQFMENEVALSIN